MSEAELKNMVAGGESGTVEFKKTTGLMREIIESLCAFANTDGGSVLVGVGTTAGWKASKFPTTR